jgi:outer membrane protein OmpA-like peptidoglycan-associated protein/tetratricopeptide (TPR) repeat protein
MKKGNQGHKHNCYRYFCLIIALFFLTLFSGNSSLLYGQQILPTPADLYDDAKEYILASEYNEALPVLLNLYNKGFHSANINYLIGTCYLNLGGMKTKAIPFLLDAVNKISLTYQGDNLEETVAPLKAMLYLGIAYRLNNEFDKALSWFHVFQDSLGTDDLDNRLLVQYHIARCENAMELIKSPARFTCDTLPDNINSLFQNFNPLATADEHALFYMVKLKFYDAVMRSEKTDSLWLKSENLTPAVKSDGDHVITGISRDGNTLLFSAYDPYLSGEIYESNFVGEAWSRIRKLKGDVNSIFNESHASFSPDGRFIYFTSDRKGGYGGLDIYRTSLDSTGGWSQAVNLGPSVNTPLNEETPFLSADSKRLFFSSQGHYNMGGYDIFCSSQDQSGQWLPPVNLGYPVNTTDDDLFFFPLDTGHIAYMARFIPNTEDQDIVRYTIYAFGNPARFTINGKVDIQAEEGVIPDNISIGFIDQGTSDTLAIKRLDRNGTFQQKLPGGDFMVEISQQGNILLSRELTIPAYLPQDRLVFNASIALSHRTGIDTLPVQHVYFDFDESRLKEASEKYLDEIAGLLIRYPEILLNINGYTDALGSDSYNMKLSIRRANAVGVYLKNRQVEQERMFIQGFGESDPVAINRNPDGTDCTEGRKYNRRVELVFQHLPAGIALVMMADVPEYLRIE